MDSSRVSSPETVEPDQVGHTVKQKKSCYKVCYPVGIHDYKNGNDQR